MGGASRAVVFSEKMADTAFLTSRVDHWPTVQGRAEWMEDLDRGRFISAALAGIYDLGRRCSRNVARLQLRQFAKEIPKRILASLAAVAVLVSSTG
jgi:hypothetical protein